MILSMTGFGKAETICNNKKIHVEIRSLNCKSIDISTRIAPLYLEKDLEIRSLITEHLKRGKVDFTLWLEDLNAAQTSPLSPETIGGYVEQIRSISSQLGIEPPSDWWSVIAQLPNICAPTTKEEVSDEEWAPVRETILAALDRLTDFRRQEGEAVAIKFKEKIQNITEYLREVEDYDQLRIDKIRGQLEQGLKELTGTTYDVGRLEQEMIYYIEKLDINEEKQRLANHLAYFAETLDHGESQGKKLGFIAQEMGREINTLGSKSNLAELQNLVVRMKDELEQIKEQVLNVL